MRTSVATGVHGTRTWVQVVGAVCAAMLFLAACGESDDGDGGAGTGEGAETPDVTLAAEGPVQTGSKVIYGLEAETTGFDPTNDRWAIAGNMMAFSIYDPLAAYDADSQIQPYLAQAFESNEDFTEWTIRVRPGVEFHNGDPLDGEAVRNAMQGIKDSALTGGAFRPIDTIAVDPSDDMAVIVTVSQSWASFPTVLVGQAGVIPAPAQYEAADEARSRQPIGTGPFTLGEWIPDNRFVAEKNASYWMSDEDGQQLPYLDEIEFRPIPDVQTRSQSLQSGTVNLMHTTDTVEIANLRRLAQQGQIQAVEDRGENEEAFVMLNSSAEPFDSKTARNAVAYATNYEAFREVFGVAPELAANSAFGVDSPFYSGPPFPTYDPDRARELVQQYEEEEGQPLSFALGTTSVVSNIQRVELLQTMYDEVGMQVTINSVDQGSYVTEAVLGDYQANLWRQFGANDPDGDYLWWHESNVDEEGISLNIARFANSELSDALDAARATPDPDERAEQYAIVQRIWAEETPYIWLHTTTWLIAADNNIRDFWNNKLPDANNVASIEPLPFQSGSHRLTAAWVER
jgi:peptide/nickel transport system substrate-binding protein